MPDNPIEKYMKMRSKQLDKKEKSPFDHFDPQVHKRMSESELVKKLESVSPGMRVEVIAELVKYSFLDNYSKEDLKGKMSSLEDSFKLLPKSLIFAYKFIPKEGREAYFDKCIEYFIDEGIIDGENEHQKQWVRGRVLTGIAMSYGVNMEAKA